LSGLINEVAGVSPERPRFSICAPIQPAVLDDLSGTRNLHSHIDLKKVFFYNYYHKMDGSI
jgi:hypothetical protein